MTKPIIKWSGRKSYLTEYIDDYLIRLDKKKATKSGSVSIK